MDYRIEHKESQKFIAMVRAFPNEIATDDNNHDIPDFWDECYAKNLIEPMRILRPVGKKDIYGLCSPTKENETHFNYGIGFIIDEDTDISGIEELVKKAIQFGKLSLRTMPYSNASVRTQNV